MATATAAEPSAVFYTVPQVARMIGINSNKVLGWIRSGRLHAINTSGGAQRPRYKIRETDLEVFLNSIAVNAAPSAGRRKRAPSANVIEFVR